MSSRGFPSMTALLGLLAIAGYQNREKIGEWVGSLGGQGGQPAADGVLPPPADAAAGEAGQAGGLGGLKDLVDQFRNAGHAETVDSWVGSGPNQPAAPAQLESALGPDLLQTLAQQTGLTKEELLSRLSQVLPSAVDHSTPSGRVPA